MDQSVLKQKAQNKKRKCYVCKQPMADRHPHYGMMCMECGDFNEKKRLARHDLGGYIALVTGGRTKIGYYTALRLLRDGARVIVTSRFPYDALQRYMEESDFENWKERIHIYGLDFRQIDRVEMFAHFLNQQFSHLDIIINNAAQTVRMPEEEYQALVAQEREMKHRLPGEPILSLPSESPVSEKEPIEHASLGYPHLPATSFQTKPDVYDPKKYNAWTAESHHISLMEMLEVQLINVTAPFLLNSRLKSALMRSPHRNRFIVNVSSVEGKFNMRRKGRYHVHTNMAKASLNMMTLTLAKELKRDRIFVTSVDPGWVSNQYPDQARPPSAIQIPLDFHDAAARICDPIYEGKDAEKPMTGVFLKDFQPIDW